MRSTGQGNPSPGPDSRQRGRSDRPRTEMPVEWRPHDVRLHNRREEVRPVHPVVDEEARCDRRGVPGARSAPAGCVRLRGRPGLRPAAQRRGRPRGDGAGPHDAGELLRAQGGLGADPGTPGGRGRRRGGREPVLQGAGDGDP